MQGMKRNEMIAVTVGIVVVFGILVFGIMNSVFTNREAGGAVNNATMQQQPEGLVVEDIEVGSGEEAVAGKVITAHYTGTLEDGTVFDSSVSRGVPFSFVLGAGQVIQGWDLGIQGMKVGGKRMLTIPPELAYGDRAIGAIPAGSTLIFEVELLGVADAQ